MATLANVKKALGITDSYQDDTLQVYFDEVVDFLTSAGVARDNITDGIVALGITDLWNYGSGDAKFSAAFIMRATQLSYKN